MNFLGHDFTGINAIEDPIVCSRPNAPGDEHNDFHVKWYPMTMISQCCMHDHINGFEKSIPA